MADGADRKDADLVADVRAGHAGSFAPLFDRWFGPALTAAEDIVGEGADAARVATDTFQAVWLHLDDLADPDGFGAWVLMTSRTFARQRLTEREPGAGPSSGPLFSDADQLRRAVAKVLVRRQVPALVEALAPSGPVYQLVAAASGPAGSAATEGSSPGPEEPTGAAVVGAVREPGGVDGSGQASADPGAAPAGPVAETDLAPIRVHRYGWSSGPPTLSLTERVRSVRLSPGTLFAVAIVLVGSLIWLVSRKDPAVTEVERPVPVFSPAGPGTTVDGAAARSNPASGAPGTGDGGAATSLPPDPASPEPVPAPTTTLPATSGRKVKVGTVVPRPGATRPARPITPTTGVTIAPRAATPLTEAPTSSTRPPASETTPPSTERTTTTVAPTTTTTARSTTTASTGRTTTTVAPTTTTASTGRTTTTTARSTTTASTGRTTTTVAPTTTATTVRSTTTASTGRTTTTTAPPATTASTRPPVTTASSRAGSVPVVPTVIVN